MRGGRAAEAVAVLILTLGTWLAFAAAGPPAVVAASADPAAFSAARAMTDLQVIAATPHAVGSAAHDRLRDYLVDRLRALGCDDAHIQSATGFNTLDGPLASTVANVVARRRGTGGGPAILLSAHYDAVPRSFGAGDDGAGVAAILETMRALVHGAPLAHDVIVTFVDAEEEGLLGAEAFVDLHPWAKDAGVVLNFDGRGNRGPVYMFQTSPGNAPLIRALAQVDDARTNSLTGEVYRHLPSDTDLSIWLHSAFPVGALNFAQVDGYTHYHTPIDNLATLDQRVVQQMGDYALSLTRALDRQDLAKLRTADAIYFNAPLIGVIRYPATWPRILAIDAFALALFLIGMAWYRRRLTLRGVGRGTAALAVTLVLPAIVIAVGWRLVSALHPAYREILQGDPYNSRWYLLAGAAFTVAVAIEAQRRASHGAFAHAPAPLDIAVAPLLLWGIAGLAAAILLPGASYLFAWPLFAATMAASWWQRATRRDRTPSAWLALLAIPALILWAPLVMQLEIALTVHMLPFCAVLLGLMLSIVVLPLQLAGELRPWIVRAALAVALVALVGAELSAGFNIERKRPDSLAYVADADSAQGWWVSFDDAPDAWTTPTLGEHPARREFAAFGLTEDGHALLASNAGPPHPGPSPVRVLDNARDGGGRHIHLHIDRTGDGEDVALYVDSGVAVSRMTISGRVLEDGRGDRYTPRYHTSGAGQVLRYFGVPDEGLDVRFTIARPSMLRVVTAIEGLPPGPSGPLSPRPPDAMSKPFVATDMTIVRWSIQL